MRWLDDPEFIVPLDIIKNIPNLIQNQTFIQNVIKKEMHLRKKNNNKPKDRSSKLGPSIESSLKAPSQQEFIRKIS